MNYWFWIWNFGIAQHIEEKLESSFDAISRWTRGYAKANLKVIVALIQSITQLRELTTQQSDAIEYTFSKMRASSNDTIDTLLDGTHRQQRGVLPDMQL